MLTALTRHAAATSLVPRATNQMGNAYTTLFEPGYQDETPRHTIYLSSIRIATTEVSAGLWSQVCAFAQSNGYDLPSGSIHPANNTPASTNHPIVNISWYDAVKWCNARSEMENFTPVYYTDAQHTTPYQSGTIDIRNEWVNTEADGYRLPTEAEWEVASRGGRDAIPLPWATISNHYFDILGTAHANYDGTGSMPVGMYPPNAHNLYDMAGNVSEWCWDWFDSAYYGASAPITTNPPGPAERPALQARVSRGGSWFSAAEECRCSARNAARPSDATTIQGFRVVQNVYLTPPQNLRVDNAYDPLLHWSAVEEALTYQIWRQPPDSATPTLLATTSNTSYRDSHAAKRTTYNLRRQPDEWWNRWIQHLRPPTLYPLPADAGSHILRLCQTARRSVLRLNFGAHSILVFH